MIGLKKIPYNIKLVKKLVWIFPSDVIEKSEWTFWPTQQMSTVSLLSPLFFLLAICLFELFKEIQFA